MGRAQSTSSSLSPRPRLEAGPAQRRQPLISAHSGALRLNPAHLWLSPAHLCTASSHLCKPPSHPPPSSQGKRHPSPAHGFGVLRLPHCVSYGGGGDNSCGTGPRTGHVNTPPPLPLAARKLQVPWAPLVLLTCGSLFSPLRFVLTDFLLKKCYQVSGTPH